jgi:hypothetical protein
MSSSSPNDLRALAQAMSSAVAVDGVQNALTAEQWDLLAPYLVPVTLAAASAPPADNRRRRREEKEEAKEEAAAGRKEDGGMAELRTTGGGLPRGPFCASRPVPCFANVEGALPGLPSGGNPGKRPVPMQPSG